mmetsp:Transcript_46680/g.113664  ORF Transcript_46680/g.113664 Transcript_46680/m.113664 type:complete len:210 (+) Transcript_46680:1906-2535(+)
MPSTSKNCCSPSAPNSTVMVCFSPLGATVPVAGLTVKLPNLRLPSAEMSASMPSCEALLAAAVPGRERATPVLTLCVMQAISKVNSNSPWLTMSKVRLLLWSYVSAPKEMPFWGSTRYLLKTDRTLILMGVEMISSPVSSSDTTHRSSMLSRRSTSSCPGNGFESKRTQIWALAPSGSRTPALCPSYSPSSAHSILKYLAARLFFGRLN